MATRTIAQIIEDIDLRMPNVFDTARKVEWFNVALKDLYKEMGFKDMFETLTIKDQSIYFLRDDDDGILQVEPELITNVTVSQSVEGTQSIEYKAKDYDDALEYNSFSTIKADNKAYLILYPVPRTDGLKIKVFFKKRPKDYAEGDVGLVPQIDQDYYEAIKYHIMSTMAEAMDDINKYNNLNRQYNTRLKRIMQEKAEAQVKYQTTKNVNTKYKYRTYGRRSIDKCRYVSGTGTMVEEVSDAID